MSWRSTSALGYKIEYLILKHVLLYGCLIADAEFEGTRTRKVFSIARPSALAAKFHGTIVYLPAPFNFRALDGILAYRAKGNEKAVVGI
jgi:hypothetical protein